MKKKPTKDAQLNFRVSIRDRDMIREAARIQGKTVSTFIAESARMFSFDVIMSHLPKLQAEARQQFQKYLRPNDQQTILRYFKQDAEKLATFIRELEGAEAQK